MTYCKLLSMQSLLEDIFVPILIDSFSLEEIKLENFLLACSQNTFMAITLRNQKMAAQIFLCCKGPLGQYKFLKKKILKLGADNFFGRFLIFSFGPWRPLGARNKKFFSLKFITDPTPTEVYFTIF